MSDSQKVVKNDHPANAWWNKVTKKNSQASDEPKKSKSKFKVAQNLNPGSELVDGKN